MWPSNGAPSQVSRVNTIVAVADEATSKVVPPVSQTIASAPSSSRSL